MLKSDQTTTFKQCCDNVVATIKNNVKFHCCHNIVRTLQELTENQKFNFLFSINSKSLNQFILLVKCNDVTLGSDVATTFVQHCHNVGRLAG